MDKRPPLRSIDAADTVAAKPAPTMFVARGKSVQLAGVSHGPGSPLCLESDERLHLERTGFLVAELPNLEPPPAHNPGAVGYQNKQIVQGPDY
jgi:hypothetical protein